jgi:hypothetical protein
MISRRFLEEHGHPTPTGGGIAGRPQPLHHGVDQLPRASRLERQIRAHDRQRRRLLAENRPRAEGADDLVVSHVDEPDIRLQRPAIPGNRNDGV